MGMLEAQKRRRVDAVSSASDSQRGTESETVGDSTSKETDNSKGRVQGHTVVILDRMVLATKTATAHAHERVEHAGAQETDKGNHQELDLRRGVPVFLAKHAVLSVDPSGRQEKSSSGIVMRRFFEMGFLGHFRCGVSMCLRVDGHVRRDVGVLLVVSHNEWQGRAEAAEAAKAGESKQRF